MNALASVIQRRTLAYSVSPLLGVLAGSAFAWIVLSIVFSPVQQNFPLNDDWAFARGAFLFARGEGIHYSNWASMPQLGQWVWACPLLWLLGDSFFALRVSTIVLSWFGLWAFYDLLRQEGIPAGQAALATGTLAFNPLFFLLQGTFMTDVPSLSFTLAALALYGRGLRSSGTGWFVGGCVVACLAAATRQNTAAVAVVVALLLWRHRPLRGPLLVWVTVLLPAAVAVAVHLWFQRRLDVRPTKPQLILPQVLLQSPFVIVHCCGLSSLPLLLRKPTFRSWKLFAILAAVMVACAGYWLWYGIYLPYGGLFPYTENMLTPYGAFAGTRGGLGPYVAGERPLLLGTPSRVMLSLLGCAAGALLVVRAVRSLAERGGLSLLPLLTLLQVPFILIIPAYFDRYLLFFLPGALALALSTSMSEKSETGWLRLQLAALVVLGSVSLGLMHDWLAWNTARWELGQRAIDRRHIDPCDIEGGVEWDGWYAGIGGPRRRTETPRWPVLPFTREWCPRIRGRFVLSFSDVRGYRRLDAASYSMWLIPGRRQFYFLELPPLPPTKAGEKPKPGGKTHRTGGISGGRQSARFFKLREEER
ncbi:MAG TPA: glycosyltransferase family 39 protein [Gemmataceae bacterium]|nr:glycosyltransferase family 39 protein [Gemmataceae bacterium]